MKLNEQILKKLIIEVNEETLNMKKFATFMSLVINTSSTTSLLKWIKSSIENKNPEQLKILLKNFKEAVVKHYPEIKFNGESLRGDIPVIKTLIQIADEYQNASTEEKWDDTFFKTIMAKVFAELPKLSP